MNLLEEAKIRYPIGTVFSNKNLGYNCTNIKIRNSLFHEEVDIILFGYLMEEQKEKLGYLLYMKGVNGQK